MVEQRIYTATTGTLPGRLSWGALFGGMFVAIAVALILNTFGVAVGLTGDNKLGAGMAIWSGLVALVSLFSGGYVMSLLEAPLAKFEAFVRGTVLWSLVMLSLFFLSVMGLQIGAQALTSAASSLTGVLAMTDLQRLGLELGLSEEQIRGLVERLTPGAVNFTAGAWWSFISLAVSYGAVIVGSLAGRRFHVPEGAQIEEEKPARTSTAA